MRRDTDIVNNDGIQKAVFIILLLFSIHFWDIKYIPQKLKIENMITWFACGYCLVMVIHKDSLKFKNAIFVLLFGILANTVAAYINLGQSPTKTLLSFEYYWFILMYFLLHYLKLDRKYLEKVILVFAVIYSILYLLQEYLYPYYILKSNVVRLDKGEFQFAILGHGFLMLAYFLCLNRYLLNRKLKDVIFAFGFFVVLLMCNYRTLIGGAILLTVVMIVRIVKLNARDFAILFFIVILVLGLFQFKSITHIFTESVEYTKSNINEGKNYVRMIETEFYYKLYPQNISYFILGGGKPSGENLYKFNPGIIGMNYNIVWVDIGLLGFYMVIGAFALLGMLWYTTKAIFIKLPKDKLWLNLYFLYLLIVSITNEEIFRDGIFCVHAIGLYLIDLAVIEKSASKDELTEIDANLQAIE